MVNKMLFTKTMKLRIYPSEEQILQLQQLTEVYRQACNFVSEYICSCGYRANDDLTGARNIQMLGTLWVSGNEKPSIKKLAVSE